MRRPSTGLGLRNDYRECLALIARVIFFAELLTRLILDAAPGVLELAFGLVGLTFVLHFFVAEQLAGTFLNLATGLLHAALGAIVVNPGSRSVVMFVVVTHGFLHCYVEGSTHQPWVRSPIRNAWKANLCRLAFGSSWQAIELVQRVHQLMVAIGELLVRFSRLSSRPAGCSTFLGSPSHVIGIAVSHTRLLNLAALATPKRAMRLLVPKRLYERGCAPEPNLDGKFVEADNRAIGSVAELTGGSSPPVATL